MPISQTRSVRTQKAITHAYPRPFPQSSSTHLMQALALTRWGRKSTLTGVEKRRPRPGAHDVLVKVHATSVNPKDWKLNLTAARALAPLPQRWLPPFLGDDLAGEVLEVGAEVTQFQVGDAIYGMDMRPRTAALADMAIIHEDRIATMPPGLNWAQAASMPLAAQTALQGLRKGQAKAGSQILIIGASGGVGTFALQIAAAWDCEITAVCSGRNAELVRSLGAEHVIDYTTAHDWREHGQYDLIFDVTSYETPQSCAALRKPASWFISTGGNARAYWGVARARDPHSRIVIVESHTRDLQTLNTLVAAGSLSPVIDSIYPFAGAQQAYQRSRSGRSRGKVIIEVG